MTTCIIKRVDGNKICDIATIYSSRKKANDALIEYINHYNKHLDADSHQYLTLFDFALEEYQSLPTCALNFTEAQKFLLSRGIACTQASKHIQARKIRRRSNGISKKLNEEVKALLDELNPMHIQTLLVLNRLLTLAQAWNEADDFQPLRSGKQRLHWYPWFELDKYTGKYACAGAYNTLGCAAYDSFPQLCFSTRERARQFGECFVDLFDQMFNANYETE